MAHKADDERRWSAEKLAELFRKSADVKTEKFEMGEEGRGQTVYLTYAEGLAESKQINQYVLPRLEEMVNDARFGNGPDKRLELTAIERLEDVPNRVFSGQLAIFFEEADLMYSLDIANPPHREPQESSTEIAIKGPRDGFVEEAAANVALVRKRIRTNTLCHERFTIGSRTQSKVSLLYIDDIIHPDIINEARSRLQKIDIDALFGSSQLEQILSDYSPSLFPLLDHSSRPDYVADALIRGRFAVIADGAPIAIIGPANLTMLLKSPEDVYFPFYFSSMGMLLRLLGLIISLLLPGFWVALASFNVEQLPYPLVATIGLSRIGLPFPAPLEAFLMLGMFELFREAGVRLPKAVGQTVAVVGGIVIGDAAIRAGLASTTLLVVAAITAVASFTLVNQSLVGSVSIVRLFILLCASILGMYGFILATISVVFYMSRLESFGVPFLAPISPVTWKDLVGALLRKPPYAVRKRPDMLHPVDSTRRENKP